MTKKVTLPDLKPALVFEDLIRSDRFNEAFLPEASPGISPQEVRVQGRGIELGESVYFAYATVDAVAHYCIDEPVIGRYRYRPF